MEGGAFLTSREVFKNPIWKSIVEFRLFFLIYGNAVFSDEGVRVADDLILQRGQWLRSTRKLQEDLKFIENRQVKTYSVSTINRTIKKLVDMQRICTKQHQLGTVFTVLNYEQYQGFDSYKKTELGTELGTVTEQPRNNNKNVKKDKKEIYTPQFDEFWSEYPRKVSKADAAKAWNALVKSGVSIDEIMEATRNYATECRGKEMQFIKHAATFLKNDRWMDHLESQSSGRYKPKSHPLDKEIALQNWIVEGKNPDDFRWE
ncbi:hypothetical protein [Brevibacillus parabrevis]|uniref:hypothetical protein n=1 Tax=Brevibacillus parabrevis TaxID=54914 RepID=UPI0023804A15|nr:hypothetical protein [Brevibacillus parabrevis]WDV94202.1 hypothetical protein PSE45_21570 [Brevibacillus parabrevis]